MSKVNSAISGAATGAAVGGPWGAAIGGVGGYLLGQDDQSNDYYKQIMEAAANIPLPELQKINPELYKEVVRMNPEMEEAVLMGPSAAEGISLDPRYQQAQMQALSKLQDITTNGGRDAQFNADASRLTNDVNSNLQGNSQAIQQNMAARGMSGGMSEMVNKQMAAQQAANRQAQMGLDINAQAQQRALSALMNQGNLANQMSNTSFNQQFQKANSQDAISKFNAQTLQGVNSQNTQNRNQAQQWNNTNQQTIANQNVGVNNEAQKYNANLDQQQFNNQLAKLKPGSAAMESMADNSAKQADRQDQFLGGLFNAGALYAANKK